MVDDWECPPLQASSVKIRRGGEGRVTAPLAEPASASVGISRALSAWSMEADH